MNANETFHVGQMVKYRQPMDESEKTARYILREINGDRGFMEYVTDQMNIKPVDLVRMADIVPATNEK